MSSSNLETAKHLDRDDAPNTGNVLNAQQTIKANH